MVSIKKLYMANLPMLITQRTCGDIREVDNEVGSKQNRSVGIEIWDHEKKELTQEDGQYIEVVTNDIST